MAELHRGKLATLPKVLEVRPLVPADLAVLREKRASSPPLKVIRETHHRLARMFASGMDFAQIQVITGYSSTRLRQFRDDPAFQNLVSNYLGKVDAAFEAAIDEFANEAIGNMKRMERMVTEHLDRAEDNDELIPLKTLGVLITDRADRFGYGKTRTQINANVDFASALEKAITRSGRANVIDAVPAPNSQVATASAPQRQLTLDAPRQAEPVSEEHSKPNTEAMVVQPHPPERVVTGSSNPDRYWAPGKSVPDVAGIRRRA